MLTNQITNLWTMWKIGFKLNMYIQVYYYHHYHYYYYYHHHHHNHHLYYDSQLQFMQRVIFTVGNHMYLKYI